MYTADDGSRWNTKYDSIGSVPSLSERESERRKSQRYTDALRRQQLESNRVAMDATKQKMANDEHNQWRDSWNDYAQFHGRGRPIAGSRGNTQYAPDATTQNSNTRYQVDYKAAEDAGAFLKSLKEGKLEDATRILNGNAYSSINNAAGVSIDQDEKGNQIVSIMGKDGQPLKRVSLAKLEEQLSNMNNYTVQMKGTTVPARESILGSKELAEGASGAAQKAYESAIAGAEFKEGRWNKPGEKGGIEFVDPEAARHQAYDDFITRYGPREAQTTYKADPNYFHSQTPATYGEWYEQNPGGLGFATGSRYQQQPRERDTGSIDELVNALTGKSGNTTTGSNNPPPPAGTPQAVNTTPAPKYTPGTANPYAAQRYLQNYTR
ncbi:hypothetical protein [Kistimonas asteriae]|uniref:hypothetical protein n=1 Tax=Kistimonas asteriae TaxID=517724 RepID=UPI001BA6D9F9|nr:hypothetical protein [Kistimonas asteriae]